MTKKTKIVATIGPATESEETIEQLITAGMNVARFNTKHNEPEWHHERIRRVRAVAQRMGQPVAVLIDLQGPEIRTELPNGQDSFAVTANEEVLFTHDTERAASVGKAIILPKDVITALQPENVVLIEDGAGEFSIVRKDETGVFAQVHEDLIIKKRKTLNTPNVVIDLPSLIEKDLVHLAAATNELVDFVALSFVRNARDISLLRDELHRRGLTAQIVAKIENQAALDNLEEIIDASDAIMVARGDLGVEVPYQELAFWQKKIIQASRMHGKPVITATQMLKSMVDAPRPTRAEVTDVSNAVYDGTDAVMLSEETTIGKYPVKAVATQAEIAAYTELHGDTPELVVTDIDASTAITQAAMSLIHDCRTHDGSFKIEKIICLTESGRTARYLARFREAPTIYALTHDEQTYNQLGLVFGVEPHLIEFVEQEILHEELITKITELGIAKSGETVLIIHGIHWRIPGKTNTLKIVQIP